MDRYSYRFIPMMNKLPISAVAITVLMMFAQPVVGDSGFENQWGMKFVTIPAGEFMMGLQQRNAALKENPKAKTDDLLDEMPRHRVVISKPFYMAQTEVTQHQWLTIMQNRPGPDTHWNRDDWRNLPVVAINWYMAERFVEEINRLDTSHHYRLPTEAEWEYVARDGKEGLRPVAIEKLGEVAWYIKNSSDQPQTVAGLKANSYGVYDMLGNAWEWVADWYADDTYSEQARTDPVGPGNGVARVRRGGSYHCPLHLIRPGYRAANRPEAAYDVIGLRLVADKK